MSDDHTFHDEVVLPEADVLVHTGDESFQGTVPEIMRFNKWLGEQKSKFGKIIYTPGNHSFLFQRDRQLALSIMTNATVLINQGIIYKGIYFYGSPVTPWYFDWAFNQYRGEDIKRFWDLIPETTEVLLTHGPPYGILDKVKKDTVEEESVGCEELRRKVLELKNLKLHVFGHLHANHGIEIFDKKTFINASICTEEYKAINKPIVVEI